MSRPIDYLTDIIAELHKIALQAGYTQLARVLGFALGEARKQANDRTAD